MKKTRRALARNQIGPKIREARLRANPPVSQDQLAARLAVRGVLLDRSAISRIESQTRYLMDYEFIAIAKALRLKISSFFPESA